MKRIWRFCRLLRDPLITMWWEIVDAWYGSRAELPSARPWMHRGWIDPLAMEDLRYIAEGISGAFANIGNKEDACPGPVDAEPSSDTPPVSG